MGYEIAGGLGVKLARPDREVIVLVGDGSYLMLNSEIATSVMLGTEADHRGAGQWRLRLHRPAAARHRRRSLQQPAGRLRRRAARWTSAPMPRAWVRWRNRWTVSPDWRPRCAARFTAERTSVVVTPHRSAHRHRGGRSLVGCRRARGFRAAAGERGARRLRERAARATATGRLSQLPARGCRGTPPRNSARRHTSACATDASGPGNVIVSSSADGIGESPAVRRRSMRHAQGPARPARRSRWSPAATLRATPRPPSASRPAP